jgi:hypothetical protein
MLTARVVRFNWREPPPTLKNEVRWEKPLRHRDFSNLTDLSTLFCVNSRRRTRAGELARLPPRAPGAVATTHKKGWRGWRGWLSSSASGTSGGEPSGLPAPKVGEVRPAEPGWRCPRTGPRLDAGRRPVRHVRNVRRSHPHPGRAPPGAARGPGRLFLVAGPRAPSPRGRALPRERSSQAKCALPPTCTRMTGVGKNPRPAHRFITGSFNLLFASI